MAILDVTEYAQASARQTAGNAPQIPQEPPLVEQQLAIGASSVQSAAFNASTTAIRLHCDVPCRLVFGLNPTASGTNQRFAANQTEYKSVPKGQSFKVAVIAST